MTAFLWVLKSWSCIRESIFRTNTWFQDMKSNGFMSSLPDDGSVKGFHILEPCICSEYVFSYTKWLRYYLDFRPKWLRNKTFPFLSILDVYCSLYCLFSMRRYTVCALCDSHMTFSRAAKLSLIVGNHISYITNACWNESCSSKTAPTIIHWRPADTAQTEDGIIHIYSSLLPSCIILASILRYFRMLDITFFR